MVAAMKGASKGAVGGSLLPGIGTVGGGLLGGIAGGLFGGRKDKKERDNNSMASTEGMQQEETVKQKIERKREEAADKVVNQETGEGLV